MPVLALDTEHASRMYGFGLSVLLRDLPAATHPPRVYLRKT